MCDALKIDRGAGDAGLGQSSGVLRHGRLGRGPQRSAARRGGSWSVAEGRIGYP
ncbi:MAG: hypothetical protein JWR70_2692 [Modestobacter sp.]|jgi:hypothetical protein|nr:hypothetical protein [Modestobacter sp.]